MPTQVQFRRGTTAQNNSFTGAIGEITVDTTLKQLRVHDGSTAGGTVIGSSTANTATNIAGGTAGQVPYQTAGGLTSFYGPGTSGQLLVSGGASAPTYTNTSSLQIGYAANILGGTAGQLHYQSAANTTGFVGPGTYGQFLMSTGANAPLYQNTLTYSNGSITISGTANATTTQTGALIITGGLGVGGDIYVGGKITAVELDIQLTTVTTTLVITDDIIQTYNTTPTNSTNTGALKIGGGIGVAGSIFVGGVVTATTFYGSLGGSLSTGTGILGGTYNGSANQTFSLNTSTLMQYSVNLAGGAGGSIPYQSAANTTAMLAIGTNGYVLTSNGSSPTWSAVSGLSAGNATTATNLAGGTAGQVPYQTAPGSTSFIGTATTGNFLQANYVGAPTWTTTGTMYVQDSVVSTNVRSGTAGQIPYQTGASVTSFIGTATTGNFLQANYVGAPTWTTTGTMYVGNAVQAETIKGGGNGSILYQSAANTTSFLSTGTPGQLLMAAVGAPVFVSTSNIYVNSSRYADNITAGTAGQLHYQSAANTTAFINTATTGNFLQSNFTNAPTWISSTTMYVGNAVQTETIKGGGNGSLLYQSAANTTSFLSTGTPGQLLMAAVGAPTFTNTSSIYVNSSRYADNLTGGAGGSIPIQSASGATAFIPLGTAGQVLTVSGSTATWSAVSGLTAGNATTATNLAGGTAGQVPYQTAAGATSFFGPGTAGQLLVSAGTSAPVYTTTSSLQIGYAANILGAGTGNIHIQSANNTTSLLSTGTTGQLLMAAGGAPVFTNTSSIYVAAATQVNTQLQAGNASYYPTFVSANNASSSAMSLYTSSTFSVNPTTGLINAQSLQLNSTAYNTATNTANALYVAGGIYADGGLTVSGTGPVLFKGPVTFSGTATYILSTNTIYTDNIIELHSPPAGVYTPWFADDGKDIGFRFHYYTASTDTNAALILANDSKYLEWYSTGAESAGGVFTGTLTYGIFKTGGIKLVGGTVNSGNTSTGDLTVLGGVGIGQNLYVGGNVTVAGTINASITGVSTTATNVAGGTAGQLHYQSAPGVTAFAGPGSYGQFLMSTGASAPVYQSTLTQTNGNIIVTSNTAATSTATGALQIVNGGLGVGGAIYSGGIHVIQNGTQASSTTTGALQIVNGGAGIGGNVYVGGSLYTNGAQVLPTSIQEFTATGGQTLFTVVGGYTVGTIQVFANGVQLASSDYTASNGTTVTLNTPRVSGDIIRTVSGLTSSSINNINALAIAYSVAFGG